MKREKHRISRCGKHRSILREIQKFPAYLQSCQLSASMRAAGLACGMGGRWKSGEKPEVAQIPKHLASLPVAHSGRLCWG